MTRYWLIERALPEGSYGSPHQWLIDDGKDPCSFYEGSGKRSAYFEPETAVEDNIRDYLKDGGTYGEVCLPPGNYHPRVYRPHSGPEASTYNLREWSSSLQAVRNLLAGMTEVFRCIEPSASNMDAFGHQMRQLLILACTEVESSCKAVLKANHYSTLQGDRWSTADYVKVASGLRLQEWEIGLRHYPDYPSFKPFETWDASRPTQSLKWYSAYNAVKHDREANYQQATFGNMITGIGAAFVMVYAQFGQFGDVLDSDAFWIKSEPSWTPSEHYAPPELEEGKSWKPVDYSF